MKAHGKCQSPLFSSLSLLHLFCPYLLSKKSKKIRGCKNSIRAKAYSFLSEELFSSCSKKTSSSSLVGCECRVTCRQQVTSSCSLQEPEKMRGPMRSLAPSTSLGTALVLPLMWTGPQPFGFPADSFHAASTTCCNHVTLKSSAMSPNVAAGKSQ
jgi:hypothetical protein